MADICGLYIGGETLSLLALKQTKKGWSVKTGGVEPYAACAEDDLGPIVKAACKSLKVAKKEDVTIILPKQQAILRNIQLPSTDREELTQMARFEAERHIPFHAERHSVGFHVMRSMGVEGSEVVLGAVDGPVVQRALDGTTSAGLNPRGVELSSVALVNSLLYEKKDWIKGKTVALLAIGLESLDLVLLTDGRLIFARSISLNLRSVLESCLGFHSATQDGPVGRPEPAKLAMAARMVDCLNLEGQGGYSRETISAAHEWLERLVQELRRTYDFARREMKCPPIDAIALTGEGAILHNLGQYLHGALSLEAQIINPVGALPGAAALKFPFGGLELVIAFGGVLATSQSVEGIYRLDLTPTEYYRQLARKRIARQLSVTGVLLVVTLALSAWTYYNFQGIRAQELAAYDEINNKIKPKVTELEEMKSKLAIMRRFTKDPNSALSVLNSVAGSKSLMGVVAMDSIAYEKGKEVAIGGDGKSIPDITNFIQELRNTGKFADVAPQGDFSQSPLFDQTIYKFRLSCPLNASDRDSDRDEGGSRREE